MYATVRKSNTMGAATLTGRMGDLQRALESALREWYANMKAETPYIDAAKGPRDDEALWIVPDLDSKAVALTSPIFQRILGIELDVSLIPPNGYASIDAMIGHLVPEMMTRVSSTTEGTSNE